jgi:hypothetical protein
MAPTLGSIPLGTVKGESVTFQAALQKIPAPGGKSDQAVAYDLEGKVMLIAVTGLINGITNAAAFATALFAVADVPIQTAIDYSSSVIGDHHVKVDGFDFDYSEFPDAIKYTLRLMVVM